MISLLSYSSLEANFLELRKPEVQLWRVQRGRTSGSVELHSWITALGQQDTEVQDGRSSTLGCTSCCAARWGAYLSLLMHMAKVELGGVFSDVRNLCSMMGRSDNKEGVQCTTRAREP